MPLIAGIDCGTGFTKAVLLNVDDGGPLKPGVGLSGEAEGAPPQPEGGPPKPGFGLGGDVRLLGRGRVKSGVNAEQNAAAALDMALADAGVRREDVTYIASTGFGRYGISWRDLQVTEITSAARGAHWLYPQARCVLDIGAQCTRAIAVSETGKVRAFKSNDKCAAGSGMFIVRAARYLEIELDQVGELSLRARNPQPISSVCAVLAESEIINHVSAGVSVEDILRGIHESLAERAGGLLKRVGMDGEVTFIGGVARQAGIVRALETRLGKKINVPPDAEYICALGAALAGQKRLQVKAAVV